MQRRAAIGLAAAIGVCVLANVVWGSQTATVPPVTRMTEAQATATIEAAGLVVGDVEQSPIVTLTVRAVGTVPGAGTTLPLGSAITLLVSTPYQR